MLLRFLFSIKNLVQCYLTVEEVHVEQSPEFIITGKTLVERKLVITTVLGGNLFGVFVILLMSVILHFDFSANRLAQQRELEPYMVDIVDEEQRERWIRFVDSSPAAYSHLQNYSPFLLSIPLPTFLAGVILSLYRSVTLKILLCYHIYCNIFIFTFVLYVMLVLFITHSVLPYCIFTIPPIDIHSQCYH